MRTRLLRRRGRAAAAGLHTSGLPLMLCYNTSVVPAGGGAGQPLSMRSTSGHSQNARL